MTTQTVDGVPRELLDRIIEGPSDSDPTGYLAIKELRDFLAKYDRAPKTTDDRGESDADV